MRNPVTCPSFASLVGDSLGKAVLEAVLTRQHYNKYKVEAIPDKGRQGRQKYVTGLGQQQVRSHSSPPNPCANFTAHVMKLTNEEVLTVLQSAAKHHKAEILRILAEYDKIRAVATGPAEEENDNEPIVAGKLSGAS